MQQTLRPASHGTLFAVGRQCSPRPRLSSVVRAESEKSKEVRAYNEDADQITVPGSEKKADNALYVDQLPPAVSVWRISAVGTAIYQRPQVPRTSPGLLTATANTLSQMRQKDNLSKEMKQRLRQEYYGLGGAENQVRTSLQGFSFSSAGLLWLTQTGEWY